MDINGNGYNSQPFHDVEQQIRQITRAAAEAPQFGPPSTEPFEQKAHDLMLKSIDQVCADWVHQLELVRQNSERIEQLVLEQAAKVKSDITQLHVLGKMAVAEAQRGDEVNQRLVSELEALQNE
jgi:predicted N-acetyltransferase YhbS